MILVKGNSLRATSRMADVSINTVTKLLVDVGDRFHDQALRDLKTKRIQCDEIWSLVFQPPFPQAVMATRRRKEPLKMQGMTGAVGDVWTGVAIDADTKLVPSWAVGRRDRATAAAFINDLASRLAHRAQVTTDGHKVHREVIEGSFGADVGTRGEVHQSMAFAIVYSGGRSL